MVGSGLGVGEREIVHIKGNKDDDFDKKKVEAYNGGNKVKGATEIGSNMQEKDGVLLLKQQLEQTNPTKHHRGPRLEITGNPFIV